MDTMLLRYAVEYAACGSAKKAAERLGVSRSSVSRNIKHLEEELGTQLFFNTAAGITPTHFGDIVLRRAREILKIEEDLRFDFAGEGVYSGTVSIGVGVNRSMQILPLVLPEFHRRYPNITVQVREISSAELSIGLLNQRLDFAIVGHPAPGQGLSFEPLMMERLILVTPQEDHFARSQLFEGDGETFVRLENFQDKQFILGYPNQKSREESDRIFRRLGYAPHIALQTHNSFTAAMLAHNGMAYALVPESCVWNALESVAYYQLDPELNARWAIGIAALGQVSLSHAAEQLKQIILDVLGDKSVTSQLRP